MSQKGNIHNPFSSYYNYPKAWGEAEPQERWHSDKSEEGIVPPWLKKIGDGLAKGLGMGEGQKEEKNYLEDKKREIESTYNYEFKERNNENQFSYMPEVEIKDDVLVVKLDKDAEKHANFIDMYATQLGSPIKDNSDIVYEINGEEYLYNSNFLGRGKLIPINQNAYTKDLPSGNTMGTGDFT